MATEKILTFCGFGTSGKRIFAHLPLSKQHLALTMATALCLYQSAAHPKHKNLAKKMSRLLHFSGFTPAMGGTFSASRVWASAATQWGKGPRDHKGPQFLYACQWQIRHYILNHSHVVVNPLLIFLDPPLHAIDQYCGVHVLCLNYNPDAGRLLHHELKPL